EGRVMARICLLNGVHTPGSDWEKECPVLRAQRRQEAKNADARVVVAGSPEPPSTPARSRRVGGHPERVPRIRLEKEPQGRLRWLTQDEIARLLEAAAKSRNSELRAAVILALNTGLRLGELIGLTWERVDLSRGVIRLESTKSGRRREVPMNDASYRALV